MLAGMSPTQVSKPDTPIEGPVTWAFDSTMTTVTIPDVPLPGNHRVLVNNLGVAYLYGGSSGTPLRRLGEVTWREHDGKWEITGTDEQGLWVTWSVPKIDRPGGCGSCGG